MLLMWVKYWSSVNIVMLLLAWNFVPMECHRNRIQEQHPNNDVRGDTILHCSHQFLGAGVRIFFTPIHDFAWGLQETEQPSLPKRLIFHLDWPAIYDDIHWRLVLRKQRPAYVDRKSHNAAQHGKRCVLCCISGTHLRPCRECGRIQGSKRMVQQGKHYICHYWVGRSLMPLTLLAYPDQPDAAL